MDEVVECLYNKDYKGTVYIDDALKSAIDAYYEQYGAKQAGSKLKDGDMMEEKTYKSMGGSGALSIAVGVVSLVVGVASGVLLIISGAKLLAGRNKILF